jgi:tetratricopeptide (TPR) repeat protein
MNQDKENFLVVVLFAFFCLILYFNSLWGIFIFDDLHGITNNTYIKDARYLPLVFKGYYTSDPDVPLGMFRPLLLLTFSFNYLFGATNPLGYHIINLLLHFVNTTLFYRLLRVFKPDLPFGLTLLLSLLFISHPLKSEAVTYVSCRSDLMIFLIVFLGIIAYLKKRFFLGLGVYLLGLLTKETAMVYPFLITAFICIYRQDPRPNALPKNKSMLYLFLLIGITMLYLAYRGVIFGQSTKDILLAPFKNNPVRNFWPNTLTQSGVSLFYLRLFFFPYPLTIHHNFPTLNSILQPLAAVSVITLSIAGAVILALRKRWPLISLGLSWYLICLMPKFYGPLNIIAAEHHFYLPSFGIYLVLAVAFKNLYLKFQRKFTIIACGIIAICSILVWFRNYEYKDEYTFWMRAVKSDPTSAVAHYNLGVVYARIGLYPEAEEEFKKAQILAPHYARMALKNSRESLASVYRLQKKFDEALQEVNKNIESGLYNFDTYYCLGNIYLDMKDEEKTIEAWEKGLSLNPKSAEISSNLGVLYLRKRQLPKAKEYFLKAIEANPFLHTAYFGMGVVLEEEGDLDSAISAYERSLSLQPNYVDAHYHLGALYAQKLDPRALVALEETVRLSPKFAKAHYNLAVLYASLTPPKMELARTYAQKAISLGYEADKNFLKIIGLEENK